ncbi:siderophore biosynthetic enzyme [Streptomyces laurentii]|uniref:Lysine N-acyltransferase MbtK n=2 Tax=Streptomyces laurentii TaxID=39478 RepID=A0A160NZQ1_STRLU|nr:siderophore biosynthetic enzyme [Streptomyces laurentii]
MTAPDAIRVRPLDPARDAALVHGWVTHPKAVFWMMGDASVQDVEDAYAEIAAHPHHDAFLGYVDGEPAFLMERYDPAQVELTGLYPPLPGDVGMHFLVAPSDTPVHGFTRRVITGVMRALFADPATARVVVEPDVGNTAVHALNAAVGFVPEREIDKPEKRALLSFCTRAAFEAATGSTTVAAATNIPGTTEAAPALRTHAALPAADAVAHLTPARWADATRALIRKALAEFAHERLLTPRARPDGGYEIASDDDRTTYRFTADRYALDHWQVHPESITRHREGRELPLDALAFVTELRGALGLSDAVLPVYLEEISATLAGTAFKATKPPVAAAELARSGFQDIETGMTEGHPCFVANNGRLGFGIDEYRAYAPEAAAPVHLVWLAAHRDRTTFTAGDGLDYESFVRAELGDPAVDGFAATLAARGLDLADYLLVPVHPWQWWNKLSVTFAAEVAQERLVYLGEGADAYLAQQSIRTFFNSSDPAKHYVKTALSVLNMGFMRGLSAAYMAATPAINDWLAGLIAADPVFTAARFSIIRERAAVGYRHLEYEAATDRYSPYRKMLAALWRESPVASLGAGERLATMASLLHTDGAGASFAGALIKDSGLAPADWLRRYLDAYLLPVLHSFYAYDLAYMPHGENVILVLDERGTVVRAVFKDIAEEIVVMDPDAALPPAVERIRADVPEDMRLLSVFTDVFDCFFRFLGAGLAAEGALAEDDFWRTVAACVREYQASRPELSDRFERYDMFAPAFALSALNRLQLRDNRQMVDLADPSGALQLVGELENPIARFA